MKTLLICLLICLLCCACVATTGDLQRISEQIQASEKRESKALQAFQARMEQIAVLYETGQMPATAVADAIRDQSKEVVQVVRESSSRNVEVAKNVASEREQVGLTLWDVLLVAGGVYGLGEFTRMQLNKRKVA